MPAAAIGALVDLQAAFTLLLTPRKVLLRFCQRGVTVLRFARLVSLGAVALFRKMGMARILPREHVVKRIEAAQLRVELRLLLRPRRAILLRGHSLPPPSKQITSPYTKLRRFIKQLPILRNRSSNGWRPCAAASYFGLIFFTDVAKSDPVLATLLAFVTFAVSFLARPFGSLLLGHFGDRLSHKKTLVALVFFRESKDVGFEQ
ncbi:hypothetical protein [Senegalimassilia anaerobia]